MARENEKRCLEDIKNSLLGTTNISVYSNCDLEPFSRYIFSAKPNMNSNVFPDFVFDGGGIEHFELTSSRETRKGSDFKIEESDNKKISDEYHTKIKEEFASSEYRPYTVASRSYEEIYDSFSYEDFLKSLERNIKKHMDSLKKSKYEKKMIIMFLMEQQTARLWIDEGVVPIKFYELHKDKRALEIIKENCSDVNYLIYFVSDSIEIIDINKINELLLNACVHRNVKGGRLIKQEVTLFLDL